MAPELTPEIIKQKVYSHGSNDSDDE